MKLENIHKTFLKNKSLFQKGYLNKINLTLAHIILMSVIYAMFDPAGATLNQFDGSCPVLLKQC